MEMYTTPILLNDRQQTILIYKSETPMTFSNLGFHKDVKAYGDTSITTTYITEPYIYREIPPEKSDSGPYYYYWFLLAKDQGAADIANRLAQDNAVLQEAANILMGVE